jgi:hypothetical protein
MIKRLLCSYALKFIALLLIGCVVFTGALAEGGPSLNPMLDEWLEKIKGGEASDITLSATLMIWCLMGKRPWQP